MYHVDSMQYYVIIDNRYHNKETYINKETFKDTFNSQMTLFI